MKESESTTTTSTTKMGNAVEGFGKKIASVFSVAAIVAFTTKAASQMLSFSTSVDKAMREVSTISKAVASDIDGYKNAILDITKSIPIAADDAASALYQIVSAGYDGADALKLLKVAAKAAVGGVTDTATAADALTTLLNAYKLSAEDAERVSDMLFTTVKLGKTTMGELGQQISQVAPIAASFGVEIDQVLAAVSTLTKSGTPTAQAMTQIRAAIIAASKALGDGYFATHTFQEGMNELREKSGGSEAQLRKLVPEVEALNGVLGVTGINATTAAKDLDQLTRSAGAMSDAFEQVLSYDEQFKMLGNSINAYLAKSGGIFEKLGIAAEMTSKMLQYGTFDTAKVTALDDYAKGLDHILRSAQSAEESLDILRKTRDRLATEVNSYDKGNLITQPSITTGQNTDYEMTTYGKEAYKLADQKYAKYKMIEEKITELEAAEATKRSIKELDIQSKTLEELQTMRDSYGKELNELQQAQLDAITTEITSRASVAINVEVLAESSNSIAGLQAKIAALKELANVDPNTEKIREYGEEIATLSKELSRLVEARDTGILRVDITPILGDIDTKSITKELDNVLSEMYQDTEIDPITIPPLKTTNFYNSLDDLAIAVGDIKSIASSFGSELGDALADGEIDGNDLKAMFVSPLAEAAASFAPLLIAQGQAMNALKSGNGWAMIAGGIALAAISSAVVAAANATNSSLDGSGTSSTIDTFTGGYSSGTSDDIWTTTRSIDITVTGKLEGQDIALSSERYYKYNNR